MSKTHAKDYLIEYANSIDKEWLRCLIIESINSNGNISEGRLNEIYLNLAKGHALTIPIIQDRGVQRDSILFQSLKHISGINALANNQTITFSPNVTILHGMNGAGKSSYFRILNEVVGGNQIKTILSNIYIDNPQPINVEIKYKKVSASNGDTIIWTGTNRALPELNNCCVFDSSYLSGFLQVRSVNEALILPLGLRLFTYIASMIDEFKNRLNRDVDNIKSKKPNIDYTKFTEGTKKALLNNEINPEFRAKIESCYNFSDEDRQQHANILQQLKELKQINTADKIALISKNKQVYDIFKKRIGEICQTITNIIPIVSSAIKDYTEKKEKNINAQKQFAIFSTIPDSDSPEWKIFIQAAHTYHPACEETICPYCRQTLQTEASKALLKAYFLFITDKTEDDLQGAEVKLKEILEQVEVINIDVNLPLEIDTLLKENVALKQDIKKGLTSLSEIKNTLIRDIKDKIVIKDVFNVPDFTYLIALLDEECKKIDKELNLLNLSPDTKVKTIESLETQRKILEEKEDIAKQSDKFIAWFKCDEVEKKLQRLASAMSTTDITRLSNKANDELLTEKLKNSFAEELIEFGKQGLQVELVKAGNSKGKQNTKLILKGNKNVTDILSEGEQKAIGLALFIAEIKSLDIHNPIILDDPVNSLDHQIAGAFAERLLKLNNQIILFNHNLLFLDAFECSRSNHICKSGKSACCDTRGKHIKIYKVCDEGVNTKGVIIDYKRNKAEEHIKEAAGLLNHSPFEDYLKVAALIRKAVECTIDEVIFKGQCPTKYSTKNSRIDWNALINIGADRTTIDKLHKIHDRVSGGEMHNGNEAAENPIRVDELKQYVDEIKNILST